MDQIAGLEKCTEMICSEYCDEDLTTRTAMFVAHFISIHQVTLPVDFRYFATY